MNKLLVILACAIVLGVPFAAKILYEQSKPDYVTMRAYVVSHLSDEQIRKAHIDAEEYVKREYARQKREDEVWRREKEEKLAPCSVDIAYKERHPGDCEVPLNWASQFEPFALPPIAVMYEQFLMGACASVETVREAKSLDCLPK